MVNFSNQQMIVKHYNNLLSSDWPWDGIRPTKIDD